MKHIKHKKFLPLLLAPLLLAGCGDGWTTQPYHGTPYGDRTAGSGVEYVREHMAPPATINTETQTKVEAPAPTPPPAPEAPAPAETKKGDAVFHKATLK